MQITSHNWKTITISKEWVFPANKQYFKLLCGLNVEIIEWDPLARTTQLDYYHYFLSAH